MSEKVNLRSCELIPTLALPVLFSPAMPFLLGSPVMQSALCIPGLMLLLRLSYFR